MAAYHDEGVVEGSREGAVITVKSDLERKLQDCGFAEYYKINDAILSEELTLHDILQCTEQELKDTLSYYNIKNPIQKNRFVNAIKKFPNSKMNANSNNNNNNKVGSINTIENKNKPNNNNDNNTKLVLISGIDSDIIKQFSDINDEIKENIEMIEKIRTNNQSVFENEKQTLTKIYNNSIKTIDELMASDEKECLDKINSLKLKENECNELRKSNEAFIIDKNDKNKRKNEINATKWRMNASIKEFENQINMYSTKINEYNINNNKLKSLKQLIKKFVAFEEKTIELTKKVSFPINGDNNADNNNNNNNNDNNINILSICGFDNSICNNGLTFHSNEYDYCLARTNNIEMLNNSGIYSIKWKIEILKNNNNWNSIGICTSFYKNNSDESGKAWLETKYYIGWCGMKNNKFAPNRLVCGAFGQNENIFYKSCQFIGDTLPQYKENDIVTLIYDSDKNQLSFELNNQRVNSVLINIPQNVKLFWFVGKCGGQIKFSIVN